MYVDPSREGHYEVALLNDPLNSSTVRTVPRFDLAQGSGAMLFTMVETVDDQAASAGEPKGAANQGTADPGDETAAAAGHVEAALCGQGSEGRE